VACSVNADCSGATPICGTDHACHGCTTDDHCKSASGGHVSELTGATAGSCVACTANEASGCSTGMCEANDTCVPEGDSLTANGKGASGGCSVGQTSPGGGLAATLATFLLAAIVLRRRRGR
jgi:MYXO-CTERM domain-containing protein